VIRSLTFAAIVIPKRDPALEGALAENGYDLVGRYGDKFAYEPINSEPAPTVQYHDLQVLENIEEKCELPPGTTFVPSNNVTRK
jgi:hypothetical protein